MAPQWSVGAYTPGPALFSWPSATPTGILATGSELEGTLPPDWASHSWRQLVPPPFKIH